VSALLEASPQPGDATGQQALAWGRSSRLALREFNAGDHAALVEMHQDTRLREHLVDDYPLHESAVASLFLERLMQMYRHQEGLGIWHATALQPTPAFVGWFSLMPLAGRPGELELGSRLLPAAWGSRLVFEGCEMLLDHAFDHVGVEFVWGICHPGNRSALAVLSVLGFESVGVLPYDGKPACHLRIDLNAWLVQRNTPRATRLRRALRPGIPGGAITAAIEGTCP
jgi:RimJ/RimL family protein N-acetyltransferase